MLKRINNVENLPEKSKQLATHTHTHTHTCNEMSTFKIKKIIDKPSLGHFSFASPRSPSYGVTACFARLLLFSIMLFGIDGCNLILYMLIKITLRKGAVV